MTFDEIETAVGQRLAAMTDVPDIAWPNRAFDPGEKYIEFRHSPTSRPDDVLTGGYEFQTGIFLLTAVTKAGEYSGEANGIAQDIADHFPKALRLTAGDGEVVITAPPSPATPFQDGAYWRQPVRVFYITE